MKFLITYDVRDHKRWRRVFRLMKSRGLNVQLSCFEVDLGVSEIKSLVVELQEMVDWSEDSVYFFPISEYVSGMTVKFGKSEEIRESKII